MGLGEIDGRPVAIGGDDFTISGGSPHDVHKRPHDFIHPLAMQYGLPCVQLVEGVGHSSKADEASGHMGLPSGDLWWQMVELLRRVPVASAVLGSVAGWPAALALMSHFTVMVKGRSQIFPSGPPVVRRAIGETLDKEALGGSADARARERSGRQRGRDRGGGVRARSSGSSRTCPTPPSDVAPRVDTGDPPDRRPEELLDIIPTNRRRGYDARKLIRLVVDNGEFFEMRRHWAGAIITGFARLDGYSVGVIGQRPDEAGRGDGRQRGRQVHALRRPVRHVQPAGGDLPRHARLHAGLGRRAEGHHAPGRAGADRQRRGPGAQGRVQRAQVLRRGRRRAQQHGPAQRPEPALRLAGGGVGRHPHRGRGGRRLPSRDRRRAPIPTPTGR